ncbi:MAG: hypothetical protein NC930_05715, partial [Candidatus Omnitrophica bacterium]|nr:hypothetical protein [Candidatus Omnitrophota bacterium]
MSLIQDALDKVPTVAAQMDRSKVFRKQVCDGLERPRFFEERRKRKGGISEMSVMALSLFIFLGCLIGFHSAKLKIPKVFNPQDSQMYVLASINFQLPSLAKTIFREPKLELSGIGTSNGKEFAVINGQIVSVGDSVDGAVVTHIDAQKVSLRCSGRKLILT